MPGIRFGPATVPMRGMQGETEFSTWKSDFRRRTAFVRLQWPFVLFSLPLARRNADPSANRSQLGFYSPTSKISNNNSFKFKEWNWKFFSFLKVSRCHKQFLKLMNRKPIIKLESLNPALFNFVDELRTVRVCKLFIKIQ